MVISNPTATSLTQLVNSPQPQPVALQPARPAEAPGDSTVVRLSDQAQQMNRAETQGSSATRAETQTNVNTERAETRPQEKAEPPGIQFMESANRNGRISTFV
jgi:hypothetical protein